MVQKLLKKRKHHVLLLRHCVRSTKDMISLWNGTDEEISLQSFSASPLPKWNTPPNWCTEKGAQLSQMIGGEIMKSLLETDLGFGDQKIRIQFVADKSERDMQTAFALSKGMQNYAANSKKLHVHIDGLDKMIYDRALFKPLSPDASFCNANFTAGRMKAGVETRLREVPLPEAGVKGILQFLDTMAGPGSAGKLSDMTTDLELSSFADYTKFIGPLNVVEMLAENAFYSRAGGIDPPFLPELSIEDVYKLVEWIHWSRSILKTENVEAASQGFVLANGMLQALRDGEYTGLTKIGQPAADAPSGTTDDDYDTKVTIFVGHDGDLDRVATVLGLRWRLPEPYKSGRNDDRGMQYIPTPPNSGMQFSYNADDASLDMALLYPTFFRAQSTNKKKIQLSRPSELMSSVPLKLLPPLQHTNPDSNVNLTYLDEYTELIPIGSATRQYAVFDVLRGRLTMSLQKYPEGNECYSKSLRDWTQYAKGNTGSDSAKEQRRFTERSLIAMSAVILVVAALVALVLRKVRPGRHRYGTMGKEKNADAVGATEVEVV